MLLTFPEYASGEESILNSPRRPCEGYKHGEDDLQTFDFISKLKLDLLEAHYGSVTRVRGSTRMQIAYRLEKDTDITLPTKYASTFYPLERCSILYQLNRTEVGWTVSRSFFFLLDLDRSILPNGLPDKFSAVCTFRARKLPKYTWHVIRIVDMENEPQFLIALNPKTLTLDISAKDEEGGLQTTSFSADRVSRTRSANIFS